MRDDERGRGLRGLLGRFRKRRSPSIHDVIEDARKASIAMGKPVRHNPEGPDADLRYTPAGPLSG